MAARFLVCWALPGSDLRRGDLDGCPSSEPELPAGGERSGSTAVEERGDDPRRELRSLTPSDIRPKGLIYELRKMKLMADLRYGESLSING